MRRSAEGSLFFEVFALGQAVRRLLVDAMADGPLTPEEYAFYSAIFEAESATPSEIADRLSMPLTTVMERVRMLEERAHARRVAHPRDGRSYQLVLTAAGHLAHRRANERFERAYRAFVDTHGDDRRMRAALGRMRADVDRAAKARVSQ